MQDLSGFECGPCKGYLIPGYALDSFLSGRDFPDGQRRLIEKAIESPASSRGLTCPSCHAKSFRAFREGIVVIDVCNICAALYLDRGEANHYLLQTRGSKRGVDDAMNKAGEVSDVGRALEVIWDVFN